MEIISLILIIFGLALFEIIISIDNAIINADVLSSVSEKARKWFLFWGLLIAVFLVRGILPTIILWIGNPSLGFIGAVTASFSSDPRIIETVEKSAPILLIGGGTFLVFVFFHWLFLEPKHYGLKGEKFIHGQGVWFFAVVSIILAVIVWLSIKINPFMAFGAVIGSTAFFITHGFKENAEEQEKAMLDKNIKMSDWSKILYLEVIDTVFSVDGIVGAFSFTFSIPLILIGNGLGAVVMRQITVGNIERIKRYKYLKNGAMYSIFALGSVMILHSFHVGIPDWVSPVLTFIIVGYFFWKSKRELTVDSRKEVVSN